jgi:hypothetical protein
MKNQAIRDKYAALTVMSQRILPSASAINKVSTLITTRFEQPYQSTERSRKQALESIPVPPGFEGDESDMPLTIREARTKAVEELLQQSQPIRKIPELLRLTAADMPKPLKRDGGEDNAAGVAMIRVMLGSLYKRGADEIIADTDEGEEVDGDDTPVVAPVVDEFAPDHASE